MLLVAVTFVLVNFRCGSSQPHRVFMCAIRRARRADFDNDNAIGVCGASGSTSHVCKSGISDWNLAYPTGGGSFSRSAAKGSGIVRNHERLESETRALLVLDGAGRA